MVADATAIALGFAVAFMLQAWLRPVPQHVVVGHVWLMLAGLPGFAVGAAMTRLHQARANATLRQELTNIVRATAVGVSMLVSVAFAVQYKELSRLWVLLVAVSVTVSLVTERLVATRIFRRLRERGEISRRIIIVGTDAHAVGIAATYHDNPSLGYQVVGFVGDDPGFRSDLADRLGYLSEVGQLLEAHDAVGVVISLSGVDQYLVNQLTRQLTDRSYHVALSSTLADIDVHRLRPQAMDGRTMIYVEPVIRNGWRALAKRWFDVAAASSILVLSTPVWMVAALLIKLEDGGPVLFRQQRVGNDGALFTMLKLRTMVVDAEERRAELLDRNEVDGPLFKIAADPRITRCGRLLRKFSIDELPQLICVLRGTMSMVGPRPALPNEVDGWDEALRERLRVLPGLTGMWQVSGRSGTNFEQYRRMDLYYVDNWSLAHDIRICAKTLRVVLGGRGAA